MDVPEFGELDHDEQETRRLTKEAKTVQAYIYCLPYSCFKPKQSLLHVKTLMELIKRDECKICFRDTELEPCLHLNQFRIFFKT